MQEAILRYTPEQIKVIEEYWEILRFTRQSGKISEGVKTREYAFWAKYEPSMVIEALNIHIKKYPNIRENYTRGILRNLARGSAALGGNEKPIGRNAGSKRDATAEEAFRRRLGL